MLPAPLKATHALDADIGMHSDLDLSCRCASEERTAVSLEGLVDGWQAFDHWSYLVAPFSSGKRFQEGSHKSRDYVKPDHGGSPTELSECHKVQFRQHGNEIKEDLATTTDNHACSLQSFAIYKNLGLLWGHSNANQAWATCQQLGTGSKLGMCTLAEGATFQSNISSNSAQLAAGQTSYPW